MLVATARQRLAKALAGHHAGIAEAGQFDRTVCINLKSRQQGTGLPYEDDSPVPGSGNALRTGHASVPKLFGYLASKLNDFHRRRDNSLVFKAAWVLGPFA
jgi:hypothetical protein